MKLNNWIFCLSLLGLMFISLPKSYGVLSESNSALPSSISKKEIRKQVRQQKKNLRKQLKSIRKQERRERKRFELFAMLSLNAFGALFISIIRFTFSWYFMLLFSVFCLILASISLIRIKRNGDKFKGRTAARLVFVLSIAVILITIGSGILALTST